MVWKYFSTEENGRKACSHDKCEKTYSASSATTCMITHLYNEHGITLQEERESAVDGRTKKQKREKASDSSGDEEVEVKTKHYQLWNAI